MTIETLKKYLELRINYCYYWLNEEESQEAKDQYSIKIYEAERLLDLINNNKIEKKINWYIKTLKELKELKEAEN